MFTLVPTLALAVIIEPASDTVLLPPASLTVRSNPRGSSGPNETRQFPLAHPVRTGVF